MSTINRYTSQAKREPKPQIFQIRSIPWAFAASLAPIQGKGIEGHSFAVCQMKHKLASTLHI